jgi:hypothetical protein
MRIMFFLSPGMVLALSCVCLAQDQEATCGTCHAKEAGQLSGSVHTSVQCQECHGGEETYVLSSEEVQKYVSGRSGPPSPFDHGSSFAGLPARRQVPELCGNCHADVERMNPYGLRTDQLARYWTSVHGKTLRKEGDDRVAVCIDCHGNHDVLSSHDPNSKTYPINVPATCAKCHADTTLMNEFDLPVEIVEEYRESVHGVLLLEQGDTGAPTCATCHGNHSAMPPGFATVGAVCGQCHQHAATEFAKSIHSTFEDFEGCVQCHGGGEGRHFHLIKRITKPPGVMIQRYEHLLSSERSPTPQQITEAINPDPRKIMEQALPTCMDCHDDLEDDENLQKLFALLDEITKADLRYVETARRLDEVGQGVLLVDDQRFEFQDAKTQLIELAPLQHSLDNSVVDAKVEELNAVCAQVNKELDGLERGLRLRRGALAPIWLFALLLAGACYVKYRRLKAIYVTPPPTGVDQGDDEH